MSIRSTFSRLVAQLFLATFFISSVTPAFAGGVSDFYPDLRLEGSTAESTGLLFATPLTSTADIMNPPMAAPGTTGTFSRATAQYVTDFEGIIRKVAASSPSVEGSRIVKNMLSYSEDFSEGNWIKEGTCTVTGKNTVNLPAENDGVYRAPQMLPGAMYVLTATLSGTGTTSLRILHNGVENYLTVTLSATPTRYALTRTGSAGATLTCQPYPAYRRAGDTATVVTVHNVQYEYVHGQTNTNPGEYLYNAVNGFASCFPTTNGNTVDANGVVTAGIGTPLPQSYPERVNSTAYALGAKIQVNGWWYNCTTGGTSASSSPTFATGKVGLVTVTDGGVTWTLGGRLLLGYVSEPASSNKVTAYGIIPADTLGSEIFTNTTFTTDTWTKGTNFSISGGTLNATACADGTLAYESHTMVQGKVYEFTYTITVISGGGFRALVGNSLGTTRTAAGTYTERIIPTATSAPGFSTVGVTTGSIDNVSLKEVGWAVGTKSYYSGAAFVNNITGLTLSGDVSSVLSIVTDQTEIEKAGLSGINPTWKVYKLDNSLGSAYAYVSVAGVTGNTNPHSYSTYYRSSSGYIWFQNGAGAYVGAYNGTSYIQGKVENSTPGSGSQFVYRAAIGGTVYFLLPQLEELPYATSIMSTAGATATRAATSLSYPTVGNIDFTKGTISFELLPKVATTTTFYSVYIGSAGRVGYTSSGNLVYHDGVNQGGFGANSTKDAWSKLALRYGEAGKQQGYINGLFGTLTGFDGSMGSGATIDIGQSGSGANSVMGYLRNLKIYFKPLSDAKCKSMTQ